MKQLMHIFWCVALLLVGFAGCQDKLEEYYVNPETTTQPAIEKFFTHMLNNDRIRPSYWNVRTFLAVHTAKYTQTVGYLNDNNRYQQQLDYTEGRWKDHYTTGSGIVAQFREIQKAYDALSEEEQQDKEVFLQAAKVIYLDQNAKIVDLWGAIPYTEAGALPLNGEITPPAFDDAQAIYGDILTGLSEAADYFANVSLSEVSSATFKKQDIALEGDLEKWERYANSLRLRLLMRTSMQDEAGAQSAIMDMLNNPDAYPLADVAEYNVLVDPLETYTEDLRNALTEVFANVAPAYMLETVMNPVNDPRIPAMFDEGVNGYTAMPLDLNSTQQQEGVVADEYAMYDSATFLFNSDLPGIIMTSSEVNFLKAEAQLRWGSPAEAAAAYNMALEQSIAFYYQLNSVGSYRDPLEAPTGEEITVFLANPEVQLTGSTEEMLAKVWTQKWLDFGFLQSTEGWAEMRRTNYPQLTFEADESAPLFRLPPSRLVYPNLEQTYNTKNYAQVADSDVRDGKVFWDIN